MDKVYIVPMETIEVFKYLASANAFVECYNENFLDNATIMAYVERHKK